MHDRQMHISFSNIAASALGALAFAALILCLLWDSDRMGFVSVHLAAGSCLMRVRSFFCTAESRERQAFEMGQESARVRQLR